MCNNYIDGQFLFIYVGIRMEYRSANLIFARRHGDWIYTKKIFGNGLEQGKSSVWGLLDHHTLFITKLINNLDNFTLRV